MRAAPVCRAALAEATALWPNRSRASDGIVADAAHSSGSDHNDPDKDGFAEAFDLTHDPANGCDAHALVRAAVARRDRRIKYAISNGQIWSAARADEGWRRYTGDNPHRTHAHVSTTDAYRDDTSPWWSATTTRPQEDDEMAFRYSFDGKIWTTDLVWRQHWESPGPGFELMLANTRDLGVVPAEFHSSLIDIQETADKARDAVNYGDANQKAIAELRTEVARLAAPGVDLDALAERVANELATRLAG